MDRSAWKPAPDLSAINLERRIKRHFWAQEQDYYLICAPGLEQVAAAELTKLGIAPVAIELGGVSFKGFWEAAYLANLHLRCAARILLRLKELRLKKWDDFVRKLGQIPWEFFLTAKCPLRIEVSLHNSALKHEGRIQEETYLAIQKRMTSLNLPAPPWEQHQPDTQRVMLRSVGNQAVISLDTTGQHLHKRGYRQNPGRAPLREDLAAGILLFCGYKGDVPLLDPMCGSGTLPLEAALIAANYAPGLGRSFMLENWPAHKAQTWRHLQEKALKQLHPAEFAIYGRDISPKALAAARDNISFPHQMSLPCWDKADFFKTPAPSAPGLLIINPPYGKRLGSVRQAKEFINRLRVKLKESYQGWRLGIILYRPEWADLLSLINTRRITLSHGGIRVTVLHGEIKTE